MSDNLIQLKGKDLEWVRKELLEKQNHLCILCERHTNEIDDTLCVDHDHNSGRVRAVLCRHCNAMSGKIEQRANRAKQNLTMLKWLENFAAYIQAEQTLYIHPSEAPKEPKVKKTSFKKMVKMFTEKYPKKKVPPYPKSGKLTKPLEKLFEEFEIQDFYYK